MTTKFAPLRKQSKSESPYTTFEQLNGEHPWMNLMPEGHVSYRVRELNQGRVCYFNFVLAKEIGLIPADHPHQMNDQLETQLLKTFSLQIINEYDELNNRRIPANNIKPNKYMATRYLQLQHPSKVGKTSGDGRGIWNGVFEHRGIYWDISSRGTGVTCLSPGSVEAQKPLRTGATKFGYGCGQAEIDELISAAILSESFHLQGIQTERVLCVIDLGRGIGIGVRAAPNLLRPAHLFLYLKQNRFDELKKAMDYFIDRQSNNGAWKFQEKDERKYDELLHHLGESYAKFIAQLDVDYIFAWLDWDGDNVLADAGIIDYGSVRQFGLRHDEYRYDDIERFSTNLNEQRKKARLLVQVFAQMCDFLKTGKKKPLKDFYRHPSVKKFNQRFTSYRNDRLLYRMGFNPKQRQTLLKNHLDTFEEFYKVFSDFERAKINGPKEKVTDGVNHPALYNLRTILRDLPEFYLKSSAEQFMPAETFFQSILSSFAKSQDLRLGESQRRKILEFQKLYRSLVQFSSITQTEKINLRSVWLKAQKLNSDKRITGNALIQIVEEILQEKKRGLSFRQIQKVIDRLVFDHLGYPEVQVSNHYKKLISPPNVQNNLYNRILSLVDEYKEDI